MPKRTKRH